MVEIAVMMEQRDLIFNAQRGDDAIRCISNGNAFSPQGTIEIGSVQIGCAARADLLDPQQRLLDCRIAGVFTNALQHFIINYVYLKCNGLSPLVAEHTISHSAGYYIRALKKSVIYVTIAGSCRIIIQHLFHRISL